MRSQMPPAENLPSADRSSRAVVARPTPGPEGEDAHGERDAGLDAELASFAALRRQLADRELPASST
jgi:hypothetical protein